MWVGTSECLSDPSQSTADAMMRGGVELRKERSLRIALERGPCRVEVDGRLEVLALAIGLRGGLGCGQLDAGRSHHSRRCAHELGLEGIEDSRRGLRVALEAEALDVVRGDEIQDADACTMGPHEELGCGRIVIRLSHLHPGRIRVRDPVVLGEELELDLTADLGHSPHGMRATAHELGAHQDHEGPEGRHHHPLFVREVGLVAAPPPVQGIDADDERAWSVAELLFRLAATGLPGPPLVSPSALATSAAPSVVLTLSHFVLHGMTSVLEGRLRRRNC